MDTLDFSEEEIREQLAILGYRNISTSRLRGLKRVGFTSRSGDGFLLHAWSADHNREVLSSSSLNREVDHGDPYARHTVAPGAPPSSKAPHRLHVLPDLGSDHLPQPTSQASSPEGGGQGKPFITRKVLRKHKGHVFVCDESVHSEDSDVSSLEERLGGLRVSTASVHRHDDRDGYLDEETENEDIMRQSDDIASQSDECSSNGLSLTAFESFVRGMVRMQTKDVLKPRPKSFIRPVPGHPHTRNLKKMDPVARYIQYKQEWDMFQVPGEKDRKALRWEIREQLAYQPPPARPPRQVHVPNPYVVPTEKKRSALRWEIRNDLANGLLPPKHNYRF
ncbi:hypothetical protein NHX12_018144 [Muraenolepis orangiensis]|uniref:Centriolar and ciliogenesis-associated protein HYLS1 C-terminal domain-containing protein n=1 Tax=Muraenolepis orangiensis TaxID=630683 RepID=A0A9Q0EVV4_9TELE|nr:hypothetical protein NHX12_018144 [Muraenolepis orangiensis]